MFRRIKKLNSIYNSKLGYEERYFVDEYDRGIIDVGAEHYDDLFSYYDMDGKSILDNEFIEFIEMKADAIPINKELSLCFHVPEANEEKRLELEKTLKDTYTKQSYSINRKIKENDKFSLSMLIIGLILLFPLFIFTELSETNPTVAIYNFLYNLAEITTWVFVWEAIDSYFLCRRDLQDRLLIKYRFIQSKITIKEYFSLKEKKTFSNNAKTLSNMINNSNLIANSNKNDENKTNEVNTNIENENITQKIFEDDDESKYNLTKND